MRRRTLRAAGHDVECLTIPDGEAAKTLATVETLGRAFARVGIRRADAVVALGGGVVGDTVGFTAAVYHRGVAVVQAPTTLLAMVDAAIGGKTAVNLPEGKNLLGAFHQPLAVVADVGTLATLPERRVPLRARRGRQVRARCPTAPRSRRSSTSTPTAVVARDADVLTNLVAECAAVKAAIVARDPQERTGARATLNYGHTLAHALETTAAYELPHGEAVAVGLVFAANLARALERVDDGQPSPRSRTASPASGSPPGCRGTSPADELLAVMRRDKKTRDGLTFVLPGPDGLELVDDPPAGSARPARSPPSA